MFDLAWLKNHLASATAPSRLLDGDIWWIVSCSDDVRDSFDPGYGSWGGNIRRVMEREGSPGAGLNQFYDSSRRPPSRLDYAPQYTSSVSEVLWLLEQKGAPDLWKTIVPEAVKIAPSKEMLSIAILGLFIDHLMSVQTTAE
jgi:hypothetical protein